MEKNTKKTVGLESRLEISPKKENGPRGTKEETTTPAQEKKTDQVVKESPGSTLIGFQSAAALLKRSIG